MRLFTWFIPHVSLTNNSLRILRHLSSTYSCRRCNHLHGTSLHTLRDCLISWVVQTTIFFFKLCMLLFTDWGRLLHKMGKGICCSKHNNKEGVTLIMYEYHLQVRLSKDHHFQQQDTIFPFHQWYDFVNI